MRAPVYIVSKGRWDSCLTMKALDKIGVPYQVIVEEAEVDHYALTIPRDRLLILDPAYQRDYATCDDLGDAKSRGPGPARNFAWDHAIQTGAAWHWVMDDNIRYFYRMTNNQKIRVGDKTIFTIMEGFADRYTNLAMAGPAYESLTPRRSKRAPFGMNTRVYSCNLIRNDVPFRWRGRYNEDTILSLDMLKSGWCTVQFFAFLQKKIRTQELAGGNTDAFYAVEGTLAKSRMLARVHPDVARVVWKYNRWHHEVNYRPFRKMALQRREGVEIAEGTNDYGMQIVKLATE